MHMQRLLHYVPLDRHQPSREKCCQISGDILDVKIYTYIILRGISKSSKQVGILNTFMDLVHNYLEGVWTLKIDMWILLSIGMIVCMVEQQICFEREGFPLHKYNN